MTVLDKLIDCDLDEDDIEDLKKDIDTKMITAVYAIEKMWELLKESNLPENIKIALLTNTKENK